MQLKSMMQTLIVREVNYTINRMDWKQVKQSTPLGTLEVFAERKRTSGKPAFQGRIK